MTVIGIDDTDSRTKGMCTTYVGHLVVQQLESEGFTVSDVHLIRLNPAAKHKTRGNAAVSIHTDANPETCLELTKEIVFEHAVEDDDRTNPGIVVAPQEPSERVSDFTLRVIRELVAISDAERLIKSEGYLQAHQGNGRGRIGALAAIGSGTALDDWTYEFISYRGPDVRGTERDVDHDAIFDAADEFYPEAWDTVDRVQNETVCVPHTPGPILFGIRGDSARAVKGLTQRLQGTTEPIYAQQLFKTNQGTDVHLQDAVIESVKNDTAYRVDGTVTKEPHTKEGGHVFFEVEDQADTLSVVAFEPTKHFRDVVRNLRVGDDLTLCGEVTSDTLKLEKFAVRSLNTVERVNPVCPDCGNTMKSAGANAGYRCKNCSNYAENKDDRKVERELSSGWYEVPPCARRHIAKPLIRGGFDGQIHPFK